MTQRNDFVRILIATLMVAMMIVSVKTLTDFSQGNFGNSVSESLQSDVNNVDMDYTVLIEEYKPISITVYNKQL